MNIAELEIEALEQTGSEAVIHMPSGLLGFEETKKFLLVTHPGEEPFRWLQVLDDPSLAFLVISGFEVLPDYQPDIPAEDVQFLGLEDSSDALVYNIVTMRTKGPSTINLKGPIVINRYSLIGKQVVLANASEYSVQHPLPSEE